MGVYPSSFLTPIRASVDHLVAQVHAAQQAAQQASKGLADVASITPIPSSPGLTRGSQWSQGDGRVKPGHDD
jgi:hypothetical protein